MTEQFIKTLNWDIIKLLERSRKFSNDKVSEEIYETNCQPFVAELVEMYLRICATDLQKLKSVGESSTQKYFMEDYVYPIGTLYYELLSEIKRIIDKQK